MNPNPFAGDPDRSAIWEMLVPRDSQAFADRDWAAVADDFTEERFEGVTANGSGDPDRWTLGYPTLTSYRDAWLKMGVEFNAKPFERITPRELLHRISTLNEIEISGDRALAHKKFRADEPLRDGTRFKLCCQSLYRLHRINGRWKIVGFVGYLPLKEGSPA